jgi:hypothetical protein
LSEPLCCRKSPSTGSEDPTAENVADDAEQPDTTFIFIFKHWDRCLVDPEWGAASSSDPWTFELEEVECMTKKLRRAPLPEGEHADTKLQTGRTSASKDAASRYYTYPYTMYKPRSGDSPTPRHWSSRRRRRIHRSTRARWGDAVGSQSRLN